MRLLGNYKSGLTYMMAAVITAAPAFHIGDTIEIETLLNGRNDKNFLSDQESIKRYVLTQLPKGTLGKVEKIQSFKKTGNTGLYITVTSGPNAGKKYWVLDRKGRHYLKLYDGKSKETDSVQDAKKLETQQEIGAVQDRQPAAEPESPPVASDITEASIPNTVAALTEFMKSAGESPKSDCPQSAASPSQESAPLVDGPFQPLAREEAEFYLQPTPYAQSDAAQIQSLAMRLTDGKPDNLSKAMEIHDWVAKNLKYDTDTYFNRYLQGKSTPGNYDALSILNSSDPTICDGYSNLTLALLRASNIPARKIEGLAHFKGPDPASTCEALAENPLRHPQRHAWVEAWIHGHWVALDTSADSGYTDFTTHVFTPHPSQRYMDPELFKATHTPCIISNTY